MLRLWMVKKDGSVVCQFCGAVIMTAEDNVRQAPATAGLYTSSNAAESWEPLCPRGCPEGECAWEESMR